MNDKDKKTEATSAGLMNPKTPTKANNATSKKERFNFLIPAEYADFIREYQSEKIVEQKRNYPYVTVLLDALKALSEKSVIKINNYERK